MRVEQLFLVGEGPAFQLWHARCVLEAIRFKPANDFAEGVFAFVRMLVLIEEPGFFALLIIVMVAHVRIEKAQRVSTHPKDEAPDIGGQASDLVVKADDNESARLEDARYRFESAARVGGVM